MSLDKYFFYDERQCEFVPLEYNRLERIVYTACVWILCGVVLSGLAVSLLTHTVGTPAELALQAENRELISQLEQTRETIRELDSEVDQLARLDNEMYRSVLGMEEIPYDEREAGAGGADVYSEFDVYSEESSEILKWTAQNLESLERSVEIQKSSFARIKEYYNENREKMKHIPAIKPVDGILLSSYGMRDHPILNYPRMHEGLDFRASTGDEVYATGDGVVTFAGTDGNYGRIIRIDHGFGYETRYAHLSSFASGIRSGTRVSRGERIGFSGSTGLTEGPHLHYEIHREGEPVNPMQYLFGNITPEEFALYQEIAETNNRSMD